MEWVSVNDKLPNLCTEVICYTGSGYGIELLLFDADGKFYCEQEGRERLPSHWMELPKPPKQ